MLGGAFRPNAGPEFNGGSLGFTAGIGPAQLRDAALTASFDPDRPEQAPVHGTARVVLPANAGLRLAIQGSLGVGIPVIRGEVGITIGGTLGLADEASIAVEVDWTPRQGCS